VTGKDRPSELPDHEIDRLRQAVTGRSRAQLILDPDLSPAEQAAFVDLAARRQAGEPLQYLEGSVPFGGVDVAVDRRALIPRPETEELHELVVSLTANPRTIVDVGTGSGNLAIALKHAFADSVVYAIDTSRDAVELAEENTRSAGLEVTVLCGDLFGPLPASLRGEVDVIVANPPYVATGAVLPVDIVDHEPHMALFAGEDGLDVLRRLAAEAPAWLAPGGLLACEIGETQGPACLRLFSSLAPTVERDYSGRDRFVVGHLL